MAGDAFVDHRHGLDHICKRLKAIEHYHHFVELDLLF